MVSFSPAAFVATLVLRPNLIVSVTLAFTVFFSGFTFQIGPVLARLFFAAHFLGRIIVVTVRSFRVLAQLRVVFFF